MKLYALIASFLCALAISPARAETITFQADDGVVFVRAYDQFGMAVVEFIGEPGAIYQCIAMDGAGNPLATGPAMADVGQAMFEGLSASLIQDFACRRTM
jgi:hypothetical protein